MNAHVANNGWPALVLNADFRPLSYYPLSLWSWQDAIKAVFHSAQGLAALDIPAEWHISPGIGHGIDQEGLRQGGEFLARHFAARK